MIKKSGIAHQQVDEDNSFSYTDYEELIYLTATLLWQRSEKDRGIGELAGLIYSVVSFLLRQRASIFQDLKISRVWGLDKPAGEPSL